MPRLTSGTDFQLFDTLDSTSLEAKRQVEAGENGPRWIVALTQTGGYGRRGRAWEQRTGDFAGSLFFEPAGPAENLGQVSFIVALALAETLEEFTSAEKIKLKWPNDVLIDGAKCAGILLENLGAHLAIGIGVNMVTAPEGMPYPTTRLMDHSDELPEPAAFAEILDTHFWRIYKEWREQGFEPIRQQWLSSAAGVFEEITVRLPNEELKGVFAGLDETGALELRLAEGKRTIAAGEVFFTAPGKKS
ncbi:biotin--[acetyl-CoA-carboxylase] ligase [Hyphococcus flavus]|uniref:biotin--[biotin carboxyl-carrier protein] ligase n=1 Tax=Hyphococcus flavus TaxID=1866326 RepID=A0AAE9ZBP4_9PROT|nr:biotin--[acetyl-CoA-carboxylase] ligase [Hyphococcus flavus]WDI31794.1 biotin--[acetyl-CoA-carboxylase] ligase [Hyphococcus flavus]